MRFEKLSKFQKGESYNKHLPSPALTILMVQLLPHLLLLPFSVADVVFLLHIQWVSAFFTRVLWGGLEAVDPTYGEVWLTATLKSVTAVSWGKLVLYSNVQCHS